MPITNETTTDKDGKTLYAQYTLYMDRYYLTEEEYYKQLEKEFEENNTELKNIDRQYYKILNKRKLFFAGIFTIVALGGLGSAYIGSKSLNYTPFSGTKQQETILNKYEDSMGNSYSTSTLAPNKILNSDESMDLTEFSIYGKWEKQDNNYTRTVNTYTFKNEDIVNLLSNKSIDEITEQDLMLLKVNKQYSKVINANTLTEEQINEEPYLSMTTKVYGEKVEVKQTLLENIGDIGLLVGDIFKGAFITFIAEVLIIISSKRLNKFDSNMVESLNSLQENYYRIKEDRDKIDKVLKSR